MIYKFNDEYFNCANLNGKLLEKAKAKRFLKISEPDKYGAVRVWVLGTGRFWTYHGTFLERATELDDEILKILQGDFEADLTRVDGFSRAYKQRVQEILNSIERYMVGTAPEKQS
jgi:hypothetical protein